MSPGLAGGQRRRLPYLPRPVRDPEGRVTAGRYRICESRLILPRAAVQLLNYGFTRGHWGALGALRVREAGRIGSPGEPGQQQGRADRGWVAS